MTSLTDYVKKSTGFSETTIETLILSALEFIIASVKNGENLRIDGLGYFKIIDKPDRPGRNPRTGELITFGASRRTKFIFSRSFIDSIQPDFDTDTELEGAIERNPYEISEAQPLPEMTLAIPANLLPGFSTSASANTPPPIPLELIQSSAVAMPLPELMWQIKAPDNSFVEVPTIDLTNWGVTPFTPVYSPGTGWQLAGKIPELAGIVV